MTRSLTKNLVLVTLACLSIPGVVHSWSSNPPHSRPSIIHLSETKRSAAAVGEETTKAPTTRRTVFRQASVTLLGGITAAALSLSPPPTSVSSVASILNPKPANAAETLPSKKDLSRLQRGHARVQYLLLNWSPLTEICNKSIMSDTERKQEIPTQGGGGGQCEKTPLRVQEFLGYKSTEDPLFKVDKLMLKAAPLVDPDQFENYLSAVENYREKADQGSMMAYTSSWGEANPNGGKDMIDEYLLKTKDEVVKTELLLRDIMGYLNLEVLPVSSAK